MFATSQALLGRYLGAGIAAFSNPSQSDLMQIINSGKVIWKLDCQGAVTINPSSWTRDAVIGQFEGTTFSDAFSNLDKLDIIQIQSLGGQIVWYLTYGGVAIQTTLFADDFTADISSDPLNSLNWNLDAINNPGQVGALQTAGDGVDGQIVCEASATDFNEYAPDYFLQYWNGVVPGDCFVEATLAKSLSGSINAIIFYRSYQNSLGVDNPVIGHGYGLTIFNQGATDTARLYRYPPQTMILNITGLPITQSGDTFKCSVIGGNHSIFRNGVFIGSVVDATYMSGGLGSVGLGGTNIFSSPTDVQYLSFRAGVA